MKCVVMTPVWTLLQCLKAICNPSSGFAFLLSFCAERPAGNIDILIFALGLKSDCFPVSSFSFFCPEPILNVLAIYTQIVLSSGKHGCLHLDKYAYPGLSLRAVAVNL